jgi:hypothetical protein
VQVVVTDFDFLAMQQALSDNLKTVSSIQQSGQMDIIIGCTGSQILKIDWIRGQKGRVYLASASSSDIEFRNMAGFPLKRRLNPAPEIGDSDHQRIHADLVYDTDGAEIILLNGGFPVNFNGVLDPIPPEQIQLTRALLLSGLRQAVDCEVVGLIPFDHQEACLITNRYKQLASEAATFGVAE